MPPVSKSQNGDSSPTALQKELARYGGLGLHFAATIAVFGLGGWWLDGKLGTLPLCLSAGILVGFLGGLWSLINKVPPPKASSRGKEPPPVAPPRSAGPEPDDDKNP